MKRPLRVRLQVPRRVGERHRVAGEGDGDRRARARASSVCSAAEQQRQERVVAGLGRPAAGVAGLLELRPPARRPCADRFGMPPSTFMAPTVDRRGAQPSSGGAVSSCPGRAGSARPRRPARRPTRSSSPPRRLVGLGAAVGLLLGGVVEPLELGDHRPVLVVALDELVEALALQHGLAAQLGAVDGDAGGRRQALEQGDRRRRVRHRRDVVRDLRPDAERPGCRVRAGRARAPRPCRPGRRPSWCGTAARRSPRPTATSPTGAAGGCAAWRTGRRRGRPSSTTPSCCGEVGDRGGEAVPRHVGLGTGEQQHVATVRRRDRRCSSGADQTSRVLTPSRSSSIGRRAR